MFRVSLSDSLLQTILIPGVILLIALGCITIPYSWAPLTSTTTVFVDALNAFIGKHDPEHIGTGVLTTGILAVAVLAAYLLSMFFGLLVAVGVGYLEQYILDRRSARRLRVSDEEYQRQWYAYLDSLEKAHNSYVTKQVTAFFFQIRTGLALIVLAISIYPWSFGLLAWVAFVMLLLLAVFLLKAALDDHMGLAEFRNRRFTLRPDAAARPEDILRALIDAWCQRRAP